MDQSFSHRFTRTAIVFFLLKFVEISECACGKSIDPLQHGKGVKAYPLTMTTVMLFHELRWSPVQAETNRTLYTVQYLYTNPIENFTWCELEHCKDLNTTKCDVSSGDSTLSQLATDILFRVVGYRNGSKIPIYRTKTILFNKLKNLTLTPPSFTLKHNEDGILILYPQIEKTWIGFTDIEIGKVQYQIQYWDIDNNASVHNKTIKRDHSEVVIKNAARNTCARMRLHTSDLGIYSEEAFSPWSNISCKISPYADSSNKSKMAAETSTNTYADIVIGSIVVIVFVAVVAIICVWKYGIKSCKQFSKKAPLPNVFVKIIFYDDDPDRANENNQTTHEPAEVVDTVEIYNDSRCVTRTVEPLTESPCCGFSLVDENKGFEYHSPVFSNDPIPSCARFNMTYGIGYPQDSDRDCFFDDNHNDSSTRPPSMLFERLCVYRNLLSSTSTTSTDLSPGIQDERQAFAEYRRDAPMSSVTSEVGTLFDIDRPNANSVRSNLYVNDILEVDKRHILDGVNVAYSSNPQRDVPDLLYVDCSSVTDRNVLLEDVQIDGA